VHTFLRLPVLLLAATLALLPGVQASHAASTGRPFACVSQNACLLQSLRVLHADDVVRAGRITVVKTTCALVRVLKHEALRQAREAAPTRAR
jgi:hypothetical protein